MKNLFDAAVAAETIDRVGRLTAASERQWGKMTAAQALAHCSVAMEVAVGDRKPKRMLIGRVLGPVFKGLALNEKPLAKNSPTLSAFVVADERDLAVEKTRLEQLIRRFSLGGHAGCTDHPNAFFGRMTPEEWARLQWKHLDHHLRQFGV